MIRVPKNFDVPSSHSEEAKRPKNLLAKNINGQVTVLVLLMLPLILVLFTGVMYVSLMVNAKINLQNAADLAAMAGAAEQARVMTIIGIKNYELMKNAKELAFYVNVLHNWESPEYYTKNKPPLFCAVDSLPGAIDNKNVATTNYNFLHPCETILKYANTIPPHPYQMPLWAIALNPALLPIWLALQTTVFDEIGGSIGTYCEIYAAKNREHLDEDMELFYPTATNILGQINNIKENYNKIINNKSPVPSPAIPSQTPAMKELILLSVPKIQNPNSLAETTARKNLSKANLSQSNSRSFKFKGYSPDISLEEIKQNYTFFWARFRTRRDGGSTYCKIINPESAPAQAAQFGVPGTRVDDNGYVFISQMPIGVYQDPDKPIFYVVRLKTEVSLPWPLNNLPSTIIAYAAAKPFGAKIGPTSRELFQIDPKIYQPGLPIVPDTVVFPNATEKSYDSPTVKKRILNKYYTTNKLLDKSREDQRTGRHDTKLHGPIRKWARSPKANEFGEYIFNLSMVNPTGSSPSTTGPLIGSAGLDSIDLNIAQDFFHTGNASDLMQEKYSRVPAGSGPAEKRNGYSVKLISFDEIPPESLRPWRGLSQQVEEIQH